MSEIYPWQQSQWQHLLGYIVQQRIPQALLVSGAAGAGVRELIDVYAASLLCHSPVEGQPCGSCRSCLLLTAENHPDFLLVEPDEPGKTIGIDKIRQLIVKLALKPQYHAYRVVIIQPADQLNIASANAFLKCLEEPGERTCIILLTDKPGRLPATIRSRCQKLVCPMPDTQLTLSWLRQQGINGDAQIFLDLAQGAPLLALQYQAQNLPRLRQECLQSWLQVAQGRVAVTTLVEQWLKLDNLQPGILLGWMAGWVAEIVKHANDGNSHELQADELKKSLHALAERLELQRVYQFYDALLLARSQLTTQVNTQLLLEQILVHWTQLTFR